MPNLMRLMSEGVGHDTILHLNLTCSLLTKIKPFDHLRRKPRVNCKIWKMINSLNHSLKGNRKIKWKIVSWEGIFLSNYLWSTDIFYKQFSEKHITSGSHLSLKLFIDLSVTIFIKIHDFLPIYELLNVKSFLREYSTFKDIKTLSN